MSASKLIKDLSHVPEIIGALGLSIAQAQKALDTNYLDGVERLLYLSKMMLDPVKDGGPETDEEKKAIDDTRQVVHDLLLSFAPSRYQYTETTLDVKLDLAQSMDLNASLGLGFGLPAVSINASFTVGYAYDYRAAAECRTVIHALPADKTVFNTLLDRAAKLSDKALTLPDKSAVDQAFIDQNKAVFEKITGVPIKSTKP